MLTSIEFRKKRVFTYNITNTSGIFCAFLQQNLPLFAQNKSTVLFGHNANIHAVAYDNDIPIIRGGV